MSIQQKIDQDLKEAMVSKNETKLSTVRFLKSALKYSAIEKKVEVLSDSDAFQVIQKQIKQRRESIDQFSKAGRKDLADRETAELKVLESYLPAQMSDEALEAAVRSEITALGAVSKKDFGRVMKALTERLSDKADSKKISECVGKILK